MTEKDENYEAKRDPWIDQMAEYLGCDKLFGQQLDAPCDCKRCEPENKLRAERDALRNKPRPVIKLTTPRYTCCDNGSCNHCEFWRKHGDKVRQIAIECHRAEFERAAKWVYGSASENLPERLRPDYEAEMWSVAERSLDCDLSNLSPPARVEVPRKTWVLSGSRSWDYGSKLGRSFSEIGQIL